MPRLAIGALTSFALQLLDLAFGLHLLVVDDRAHAILDRARDLFDLALVSFRGLGSLFLGAASGFLGFAFSLHLLVVDQLSDRAFDLAAELLGGAFTAFACVAHGGWPSNRRAVTKHGG